MSQPVMKRFSWVEWRKDLIPLLLFLFLPVLSFPELFLEPRTLYRGDLTWIHYPLRLLAAEQWLSGQVPLWNSYVLSGYPMLAEAQIGVLQPLNALFFLPIPPYRILTLFVTFHFTLAAIFTYILARSLGIGRAGATLGGLSFGFGGFLMAQVTNLNIMSGGAWLPLVFCCFAWALRSRRLSVALLGSVSLALNIFAAHPQISFFTALLLAGYALYETVRILISSNSPSRLKEIGLIWGLSAAMVGNGLLLAAPQVLPTWELQPLSVRLAGVDYSQMTAFSLPPVQWITLFLPNVFGTSVTGYHGLAGNFEETNIYIGLLPLVMVPLSWRVRHRPEVIFLWLAALVAGILAMGGYTPLYRLLEYLPVFNLFRAPARWLLVVNFALAGLAAYGFDAFLGQPPGRRGRWGLVGLWLGVTVIILIVWFFKDSLFLWFEARPVRTDLVQAGRELLRRGLFELPDEYAGKIILGPLIWWVTPAVALVSRLGAAVALLVLYAARLLSKKVLIVAAIALVALDVALAGGTAVNRMTHADHWQQLSGGAGYIIETAGDEMTRFYTTASSQVDDVVAGLKHYFPSVYHLFASGGNSPLMLDRYNTFMQQAHPLVRLSLTATRFVLNKGRLTADAESVMPVVYQDEDWLVYEYPLFLPRAFVMRQVVGVSNGQEALQLVRAETFDPSRVLVLETEQPLPELSPPGEGTDEVIITAYSASAVEIQANLAGDGFLVLLDNYYPGWRAVVDGQQRPILPADYFARAVYLEGGSHTVRFVYRPLSFYGGLGLAMVGLLLFVGAAWLFRAESNYPYRDDNENENLERQSLL